MSISVSLTVNGKAVTAEIEPRTLLVQLLREQLRLTGTHVGCDTGQCGACTVHLNGRAVKSCNLLAAQAQGAEIVTIEGVAAADGDAASDAGRVQAASRTAVRFLHARHGDDRARSGEAASRRRRKRPCAPRSTAICAAAPAITTSSRRCSPAPPPKL